MVQYLFLSLLVCGGLSNSETAIKLESLVLLNSSKVEIHLESQRIMDMFVAAEYVDETESIEIETVENIHSLLIYGETGELEFMLPVMSKNVMINKNMFGSGLYQIGFNCDDHKELTYAQLFLK